MKRAELIRKAEMRLASLETLFSEAVGVRDFASGKHWWSEYGGEAVKCWINSQRPW